MTSPTRPERNARLSCTARDVLDAPTPVIPVNLVGVMGRGLALGARNRWAGLSNAYAAALASRRLRGPQVVISQREPATAVAWTAPTGQVVILAPTKQHWRSPSPPELVRDAVRALAPTARAASRQSVNVPPLGCGLGGLSPRIVLPWVLEAVEATPDIQWTLHRWPQQLLVEAADRISRINRTARVNHSHREKPPMAPNVVNRRTARARPGDVYIGRPSRWGNPFVVGRHGTRDQVIELYRRRLWADLREGRTTRRDLAALAGKRLVCWCAPAPCHGDVLAAAADWATGGGELAAADWRPA